MMKCTLEIDIDLEVDSFREKDLPRKVKFVLYYAIIFV